MKNVPPYVIAIAVALVVVAVAFFGYRTLAPEPQVPTGRSQMQQKMNEMYRQRGMAGTSSGSGYPGGAPPGLGAGR